MLFSGRLGSFIILWTSCIMQQLLFYNTDIKGNIHTKYTVRTIYSRKTLLSHFSYKTWLVFKLFSEQNPLNNSFKLNWELKTVWCFQDDPLLMTPFFSTTVSIVKGTFGSFPVWTGCYLVRLVHINMMLSARISSCSTSTWSASQLLLHS